MIKLKTSRDIEFLRESGKILAGILRALQEKSKEGTRLFWLDKLARELLEKEKARAAFLGYKQDRNSRPFPAAICASVNEQVVHGIPLDYILKSGDILKIDIGVDYRGYITDAAVTIPIGVVSKTAEQLIRVTRESLDRAISECVVGNFVGDIGFAIEEYVRLNGFNVIRELTGHGVGFGLHEDPTVYNFGKKGEGMELKPGLVLALEPMVSAGSDEVEELLDGSFVTKDGSLSAHFEHTVAITENGLEILTQF